MAQLNLIDPVNMEHFQFEYGCYDELNSGEISMSFSAKSSLHEQATRNDKASVLISMT